MTSAPSTPLVRSLPPLTVQAERIVELGLHELAGLDASDVYSAARDAGEGAEDDNQLLVLHPDAVATSALAPLLRRADGNVGFVVEDMTDVDTFIALESVTVPTGPLYVVSDPRRGDELANWSPNEALPALTAQGRTPLLLSEGVQWALQDAAVLERNRCFMTIG